MTSFNQEIPVLTEEQYLAVNGAGRNSMGEPALHKNRGNLSDRSWSRIVNRQAGKDLAIVQLRDQLRTEYREKIAQGLIRAPTRIERLIDTANGHPDNESVQAARRILQKSNIDWNATNRHQETEPDPE